MKTLYIECNMGAAGDMLMAALYELLDDRQAFLDRMNRLGLPGVRLEARKGAACGIGRTPMSTAICMSMTMSTVMAVIIITTMNTVTSTVASTVTTMLTRIITITPPLDISGNSSAAWTFRSR